VILASAKARVFRSRPSVWLSDWLSTNGTKRGHFRTEPPREIRTLTARKAIGVREPLEGYPCKTGVQDHSRKPVPE
jgi:hypothetical protein